jgi:hypothetical protein
MSKTKIEQLWELEKSEMFLDFNKIYDVEGYLESIHHQTYDLDIGDDTEGLLIYWDKETFLNEIEYFLDNISGVEPSFAWASDMLYENPKMMYKLRSRIRYYLKKWGGK